MTKTRLDRERETLEAMLGIYCRGTHHSDGLCQECKELKEYAKKRLDTCRFGETKPVCGRCTVHCYKPDMQVKIRQVMKYAGPRIFFHHPGLAFEHVIDRLKYRPVLPEKKA